MDHGHSTVDWRGTPDPRLLALVRDWTTPSESGCWVVGQVWCCSTHCVVHLVAMLLFHCGVVLVSHVALLGMFIEQTVRGRWSSLRGDPWRELPECA